MVVRVQPEMGTIWVWHRREKQVFAEPPASTLTTTLSAAFAAESRRLQRGHGARSYRLMSARDDSAQQQTRWPPLLPSIDGADRRTDGRTDGRLTVV